MSSISRRHWLQSVAGGATALAAPAANARRPNILLIMADDLGYECLSCYGGTSYKTPHLDRLASTGVRFTHAYAQPLCTPTRTQLMTGKYLYRNWKAFGILDPKEKTFGHYMRAGGYRTAIAGKWQFWSYNPPDFWPQWRAKGMLAKDAGFDEWCLWHTGHTEEKGSRYGDPTYEVNGKLLTDQKDRYGPDDYAAFLTRFVEPNREKSRGGREQKPWFCYYPMALTHGPFTATPKSAKWKSARLQNDRAQFKDMVEYMDEIVGRMVTDLDRLGERENTLILFYGDNGTDRSITSRMGDRVIQGGKGLTTDAGTRVPLIAHWPGVTPNGRVLDDLIDSTDFLPTIAEAGGVRLPGEHPRDGVSFLPQLRGERGSPRQWQFCHFDTLPGDGKIGYSLQRYARTQRYKLYEDGRFFDVPADPLEKSPIGPAHGPPETKAVRLMLWDVLDRHRPASVVK
ncbi:MAG: sulfatase-like hydrolase/transferase [Bryobacteraceae bacterium]